LDIGDGLIVRADAVNTPRSKGIDSAFGNYVSDDVMDDSCFKGWTRRFLDSRILSGGACCLHAVS